MRSMLERDGLVGLRMISPQQADRHFPQLEAQGCRIDTWDTFTGRPGDAGRSSQAVIARGLPVGIAIQRPLTDAEGTPMRNVQKFLAANWLAPFPGAMLVKQSGARTLVLEDETGAIVATGHTYFPHNAHSSFRAHAWIGLIAVAPSWRGKGLGRIINALLVRAAFDELGADCVYAMVAPLNEPSRRMVEGCGLHLAPELRCGVAVPVPAMRFTR
jgi:GNAT superfamily N-acetyltransferase